MTHKQHPWFSQARRSYYSRTLISPLALAIGLLATAGSLPSLAAGDEAATPRSYQVPAGALADTLNLYAAAAGVTLVFNPQDIPPQPSAGLAGRYALPEGFAVLLRGTGLVARYDATSRRYHIEKAAVKTALPAITVSASGEASAVGYTLTGPSRSATGLGLSLRETPQAVTVITRERLDDQAIESITEVLDQAVGVTFNGTSAVGTDGVSFYSRGFRINNFHIDGMPRPTSIYGFSETTTDLALYERVEIVRGATGLRSGAGSPSATVNLVRKRPTANTAVSAKLQAGSFDHYKLEGDVGGSLNDSGSLRGRVVAAYQDSGSHIDRQHLETQLFYGIIEADLSDSTLLSVGAEYQELLNSAASRGGLPVFFSDGTYAELPRSYNSGAKWNRFERETTRIFATLEQQFDNGWSAKLEAEDSRPDYDESFGYLWASRIDRVTGSGGSVGTARWAGDLQQRIVGLSASGPFSLLGRSHELVLGASHTTADDSGDDYPGWWNGGGYWTALPDAWNFFATGEWAKLNLAPTGSQYGGRITEGGAYAALRLNPADRVSVILGSRFSNWQETSWSRSAAGVESKNTLTDEDGVVTPYAGLVVDLSESISTYVSYTSIFEAQSNEDIAGNRLDPLDGASYEAGLKGEFNDGLLNASASVFRIEQNNFAVAVPNAPLNPNGKTPYSAEDGSVAKGVELELAGQLQPGWQVGGGYARATVENRTGTALLTNIPRDTIKVFSSYNLPGEWSALTLGGNIRWQGDIYTNASGPNGMDFNQGSLALLDLMAKYVVDKHFTLALNANNVFDEKYYSGLSGGNGTYAAPSNVVFTLRYDY